ncbi:MAG TPA: LamG-like jellyroll fold domain-containing protein [Burkholderiaceae bacterium]|nr:LamG-like jellyroll fold domain-containing protein [Burkholderiaceae bacterium]
MSSTPETIATLTQALDPQRRMLLRGMGSVPLLLAGCGAGGSTAGDASGSGSTSGANAATTSNADSVTTATAAATRSFVHPGLMHTEADFARMREKANAGVQPWKAGWDALTSSSRAGLWSVPNPLETVIRGGDGENFRTMVEDLERTYQYAVRWKVSQDTAYADQAVKFLNAWSSTMKTLSGNSDRFLAAGIYGYQWANAAEIMRTYSGWKAEDFAAFQNLLLTVFYPMSHDFLVNHNGANITNYWANWDLCAISCVLAVGVLCDRADIYDEAIAYYKSGRGNGAAAHNVYYLHPGHLGQWQESGRDQGHATLGMALTGLLCEMAWNQGEDLYGYSNNRFLAGAEYVAKSNLQDANGDYYTLPFSTYANRQGLFTAVSTAGRPNLRPCWEVIYNHYVNRKGLAAPFVATFAAQLRPERSEWGGDQPSFGTLTFSRDAIAAGTPPSGLTAYPTAGQVLLSWWGSAYATSYQVKRGTSASGPFMPIASVADPRTYTDAPGDGVWYYTVTATDTGGETAASNVVRVALPSELRARLTLDASSGTTADDASGNGVTGTLTGSASWGDGRTGGSHALLLDGKSGYLALSSGAVANLGDFTIAVWVYWNAVSTNARVFDFGSSDIAYMMLTPRDAGGVLRFSVSGTTYFGDQSITATSALPTGRWVHVAVTLSGTQGTLYVDGAAVGSSASIALAPFQLGNTTQNWLGRSQYSADPYFNGRLQDLRLYSGALTAAQVAALAAG